MLSNFLQKVAHSQKVDFGGVLTNCVALFKKTWQQGAMHVAIIMAGVMAMVILMVGPVLWYTQLAPTGRRDYYAYAPNEPDLLLIILWGLLVLVLMVLVQALSIGIAAHFFKVCRIIDMDTGCLLYTSDAADE